MAILLFSKILTFTQNNRELSGRLIATGVFVLALGASRVIGQESQEPNEPIDHVGVEVERGIDLLIAERTGYQGVAVLRSLPVDVVVGRLIARCFSPETDVGGQVRSRAYEVLDAVGAEADLRGFDQFVRGLQQSEGLTSSVRALGRVTDDEQRVVVGSLLGDYLMQMMSQREALNTAGSDVWDNRRIEVLRALKRVQKVPTNVRALIKDLSRDPSESWGVRCEAARCLIFTGSDAEISQMLVLTGEPLVDAPLVYGAAEFCSVNDPKKHFLGTAKGNLRRQAQALVLTALRSDSDEVVSAGVAVAAFTWSDDAYVQTGDLVTVNASLLAALEAAAGKARDRKTQELAVRTIEVVEHEAKRRTQAVQQAR